MLPFASEIGLGFSPGQLPAIEKQGASTGAEKLVLLKGTALAVP
jgi:hypothetical protein